MKAFFAKKGCKKKAYLLWFLMVLCGSFWLLILSFVWFCCMVASPSNSLVSFKLFNSGLLCKFIWTFCWYTFWKVWYYPKWLVWCLITIDNCPLERMDYFSFQKTHNKSQSPKKSPMMRNINRTSTIIALQPVI